MGKTNKITSDEIGEILKLISEAYKKEGKSIETAVLYDKDTNGKDTETLVIDNRKPEDLN